MLAAALRPGLAFFMRSMLPAFLCAFLFPQAAAAAEPLGEWLVAGRDARIRIADCGGALWGVVSWEKDPGVDSKNPDPAKRSRPTLGMAVLLGLKPQAANRWDGALYNAENGKTYSGGITRLGEDMLRVRGCVLGILCGGETWTRVKAPEGGSAESDAALCSRMSR